MAFISVCFCKLFVAVVVTVIMKKAEFVRLAKICLPKLNDSVEDATFVNNITVVGDVTSQSLCRLWGGMGQIYRVSVDVPQQHQNTTTNKTKPKTNTLSFVVKHVVPPPLSQQDFGDRRKAVSYDVESNFYEHLAEKLITEHGLKIPKPLHVEHQQQSNKAKEVLICMSYLEGNRHRSLRDKEYAYAVLQWLATLHAAYWGSDKVDAVVETVGLHEQGTYWYLDTRPDEHENMPKKGWEGRLKRAARAIDNRLKRDSMQCLLHGDAKDANVMVIDDGENNDNKGTVAMYDFQYCGKGPPSKDLAYFLCTAVDVKDERAALQFYLQELTKRLPPGSLAPTLNELEESLEIANCDFCRFMSGWGYWGGNMSHRVIAVLDRLDGGKDLGSEDAYEAAMLREFG